MTFNQQLVITLIDKLMIALVVAIVGYFLNSYLSIREKEFEIRFGELHKKRFSLLSELDSLLRATFTNTNLFISTLELTGTGTSEKIDEHELSAQLHVGTGARLHRIFNENVIYVDEETAEKLKKLIVSMNSIFWSYIVCEKNPEKLAKVVPEIIETWKRDKASHELILKSTQSAFRSIIGSKSEDASNKA